MIGFLSAGTFGTARDYVAAFHRSLADAGFAEGRNVAIEYRWSEGHNDRLPAQAADLVRRQVTVIVAASTPAALAAKTATSKQSRSLLLSVPIQLELVSSRA